MTAAAGPGLRERKKRRTRLALAAAALRQFEERGVEATTVESICAEADVAISTFYVYFESKEAAAFPEADGRAELVAGALLERPAGEAIHTALRRASQAIAEQDLQHGADVAARLRLVAREPKLAAYATRLQAGCAARVAGLLAEQMGVDPAIDPRPQLVASAAFGALEAAWAIWAADGSQDLRGLVDLAHDTLDAGLRRALG